jgi:nucleotide-binding universal stress UspA family protein
MVLKNILVQMDTLPQSADRLDLAIMLALQHGAGIIGLHAVTHHLFPIKRSHDSDLGEQLHELFLRKTGEAGIGASWLSVDVKLLGGGVAEVFNHYATFADLVVLGQTELGAKERRAEDHLPERVVLGSGKPVLIVPYAGVFTSIGERVLIAWKTGRESSRALSDAIPLLQKAGSAHVFEVNPTEGEMLDMQSLCDYLVGHGVQAELETSLITELRVGDVLLNRVADEGSDLLVMGAYADLHFGTYALGDVARHVLHHMTVPVLMSH